MPRFSLRTLLIFVAVVSVMLAVLLAQRPWTRTIPGYRTGPMYSTHDPTARRVGWTVTPERYVYTDRFKAVAVAEGTVLAAWAAAVFCRRRFPKIPNSN